MSLENKQQGFTLIEVIVVVALLSITVGLTGDILISLVRSNTRTQVFNEVEQQANFVSLKLEKELRDAIRVEDNSTNNYLEFTNRDSEVITYQIITSDGRGVLQRRVGNDPSDPFVNLTSESTQGGVNVVCNPDCFIVSGASPQVVIINMDFLPSQSVGMDSSRTVKVQSSVVIRSTYDK